jgi:hypothetical protein
MYRLFNLGSELPAPSALSIKLFGTSVDLNSIIDFIKAVDLLAEEQWRRNNRTHIEFTANTTLNKVSAQLIQHSIRSQLNFYLS